jgi:hypothetical protein
MSKPQNAVYEYKAAEVKFKEEVKKLSKLATADVINLREAKVTAEKVLEQVNNMIDAYNRGQYGG